MGKLLQLSSNDYKLILFGFIAILYFIIRVWYKKYRWKRKKEKRRDYYRNVCLKSDAWQRKRYVVLKRDHWKCVHCGNRATQVHHKRYAKYNIGKEPIKWLESVYGSCHERLHQ